MIVAEEITGRFLNVVSLFNGAIPLIAIQLTAFQLDDHVSLVATTVLDELQLGLVEDEEVQVVTNRAYWEERGTKDTLAVTDELFGIVKRLDPDLELKYNKYYIGLAKHDHSNNFVAFCPMKEWVRIELRLPRTRAPTPRPDYVMSRGGHIVAIADAKYRDLWKRDLPSGMLYQLSVYALS